MLVHFLQLLTVLSLKKKFSAVLASSLSPNGPWNPSFAMPLCNGFVLEEATVDQMQFAMSEGAVTSERLVACYLERMSQTQPYINSVLEPNPDALAIAASLDAERSIGRVRGPLHGIPFLVKDNIASKDRMQTTAGSWALLGSLVSRDAFVVTKLRDAGAVLLGKATLSEWADMRSSNYSEGYSGRGGQCRSPYNFTVNPGGSSSGSAVAVTANVVAFSLGTETDGSVINPAERNAIVGFKPTVGRTSRSGVIPESIHQDTVGTFGRTVCDATYALDAISGIDPRDNYTFAQGLTDHIGNGNLASSLANRTALQGATFGIPWNSFWVYADPEQQTVLFELVNKIRGAGANIVEAEIKGYEKIVSPNGWDWDYGTSRGYPNESEFTYVKVDFYNNLAGYLSELKETDIRSLEDLTKYNFENDGTEGGNPFPPGIPAFYSGQDNFLTALNTSGFMSESYWEALNFCQSSTRDGIDSALQTGTERLSALLVPADVGQTYQVAAQAGYPMLTLPVDIGSISGMPFGLALMQTAWAESELVIWGSAIEDLQQFTDRKRRSPNWKGYLARNIPVLDQ